jgi:IS1 family transposase
MGRAWIHAALAVTSRFLIDLRLGPRTLETAAQLVASVATCCSGQSLPLLLIDDHRPYPAAILQVFGLIKHRRRPSRRGRKRHPVLKAPPGLQVGVVHKRRDEKGNLLGVKTYALFGRLKDIRQRIRELGIGRKINTSHLERLNGTLRGQQTRLARRTRNGSRLEPMLQCALWLWRDLYNWTRRHGSLAGQTPAMATGLTQHVWTVVEYLRYPVHVSDFQREDWAEQWKNALESALEARNRKKTLPTS